MPSPERPRVGVVACGLVLVGTLACSQRARKLGDPKQWADRTCLATYTIDHDDSPLAQLRERGGSIPDFQDRVPAAVIDPKTQEPLPATAALTLEGQPIAWLAASLDHLVMDGAAFAPLRRAEPTRLSTGERAEVGRVTPAAREGLGDRQVFELLARAGVIQTYWHLGADLCLTAESLEDGVYRAEVDGVHEYATNRSSEQRYGFAVEIGAEGTIVVIGRDVPRR